MPPHGDPDVEEPGRQAPEITHEAVTMALYISLSLLAVLVATPGTDADSAPRLALTVALTAIALILAHQVAFRLSTRLLHRGLLAADSLRLLGAQAIGGLSVVVVATLPIVIFGAAGLRIATVLLIALMGVVGYVAARSVPVSRPRALLYVGVVILAVGLVLAVKGLVGH